jgi:hypothetical protein
MKNGISFTVDGETYDLANHDVARIDGALRVYASVIDRDRKRGLSTRTDSELADKRNDVARLAVVTNTILRGLA